ncbi:aggrecan core protein-like isoform X1 [Notolabrus celidotus]|nr:aggrecan core protein-like isoform X1 [Notolabrus celidotus]
MFQRPGLTSTPVCSLKHSANSSQDTSCLHCSHSKTQQTPSEIRDRIRVMMMSAPQTPTPLKTSRGSHMEGSAGSTMRTVKDPGVDSDSQQSSSSSEVQGESLLIPIKQVQKESISMSLIQGESSCLQEIQRESNPNQHQVQGESILVQQVQGESSLIQQVQGESSLVQQVQGESSLIQQVQGESSLVQLVQGESSSVPVCEELGCLWLEGQMEVWWCQQAVGGSPESPADRPTPFELSRELQEVMFGRTDDQKSLTEQAWHYVEP